MDATKTFEHIFQLQDMALMRINFGREDLIIVNIKFRWLLIKKNED